VASDVTTLLTAVITLIHNHWSENWSQIAQSNHT